MTNYIWEGSVSALASNAANWIPNGTPAQGDIIIFDGNGTQGCTWDIVLPPSNRSVDEVIIESDFGHALTLNTVIRTKALFLNKTLTAGTASKIVFVNGASPNFFGSYKSFGDRFVMIGDSAAYSGTIDFDMEATAGQKVKFDDGQHSSGTVTLKTAAFAPDYETPTGTLGYTYFPTLTIASGVTWEPAGDIDDTDRLKEFRIDTFNVSIATFDGGMASYEFLATSGGFQIPVNDGSAYNSGDFTAKFRKMKFRATTAGHKIIMPDNRYLSLEELEIGDGVMLLGPTAIDDQGSDIRITKPPKIRGSWSFSQISPGLYRSPQHARGPMSEVKGEFTVTGKLTVTGLIDPTGMVFTPQATNPEITNPENTIWIDSETGHLVRGERDTESTVHFNVRNDEGTTIPLGAPLYSKGEIGGSQRIKVGIADASDPAKMPAIGLAMEEMNTTSTKDGNMIITGILNENITITGVVEQDTIYVAPHGGTPPYLTITRPTSGSHLVQNVGVCIKQASANVSQGMKVSAIGRTNDIPNAVITTDSADADYVYIDDGNTFKKITPSNLGIGGGGGGTVDVVSNVATNTILGRNDAGSGDSEELTPAEVRTMLNVEDGADVTDTTNVTAAGALMDSEVTNLADVKAFDPADYATAAQGGLADSALQTETDPVFTASAAASITDAGSGQVITPSERALIGTALQAEADTLDDVVGRGGTSSAAITAPQFIVTGGTSAQFLKGDGSSDSTVYIPTGQYEAGSTPISAKGFINTASDTSWISQTEGSRVVPTDNSSGSTQIFSNGVESLVTAWNQDLLTTQGITYSSGVWTIDTAGIYHIRGQFGLRDGDATGSNGLGNPGSSDFIQALAYILHSSDSADPDVGPSPTPEDFLVRGPTFLYTNGTGLSAKGPVVETIRRLDVGDRIAFALWARKQSNQSSTLKYRMRTGFYNECYIRRIG